jgi:hypothetical protein
MKRPEGRAAVMLVIVLVLIVLPTLYVLSIGPAYWLVDGGQLSLATWLTFYWPLITLSDQNEEVRRLLATYLDWWGPNLVP